MNPIPKSFGAQGFGDAGLGTCGACAGSWPWGMRAWVPRTTRSRTNSTTPAVTIDPQVSNLIN